MEPGETVQAREAPAKFENVDDMIQSYLPVNRIPPLRVRPPTDLQPELVERRNELGYRGPGFDERGDLNVAVIGCSWVEAIGIDDGDTFPDHVSRIYEQQTGSRVRVWNLGSTATGIDYVARLMPSICRVLKPDLVLWVLSTFDRRQYFSPERRYCRFRKMLADRVRGGDLVIPESDVPYVLALDALSNPVDDIAYVVRRFRGIQGMLESAGIPWLYSAIDHVDPKVRALIASGLLPQENYLGFAFERIDQISDTDPHPGPNSHHRFAARIVERFLELNLFEKSE